MGTRTRMCTHRAGHGWHTCVHSTDMQCRLWARSITRAWGVHGASDACMHVHGFMGTRAYGLTCVKPRMHTAISICTCIRHMHAALHMCVQLYRLACSFTHVDIASHEHTQPHTRAHAFTCVCHVTFAHSVTCIHTASCVCMRPDACTEPHVCLQPDVCIQPHMYVHALICVCRASHVYSWQPLLEKFWEGVPHPLPQFPLLQLGQGYVGG